jgi:hypothetical protein
MAWCDPCAADPLSTEQLRKLGVFWLNDDSIDATKSPDVFVTRLHVRYDAQHFPDDLVFQETGDRSNFQGRYILRHPWTGSDSCEMVAQYRRGLADRYDQQARTLASLTGWDIAMIREKMGATSLYPPVEDRPWWRRLWER